jgi:hypothetical protein
VSSSFRLWVALLVIFAAACDRRVGSSASGQHRPEDLYELSFEGSSAALKVGERGKVVVRIKTRLPGAHVTAPTGAPLRITYAAPHVEPDTTEFRYVHPKDLNKPPTAEATPLDDPRFEMPVVARIAASAVLTAEITFLICLQDTLCARQQRQLSIPIDVI